MYIKKRRGPRTDPWGTPEVALHADDFSPFRTTYCFLFIRYEHIHLRMYGSRSKILSLSRRGLWGTESKAFCKSKNTAHTLLP